MPDHPSWPAELVEKGARALAKARTGFGWGVINDQARADFENQARTVLSALSGDLVPRERCPECDAPACRTVEWITTGSEDLSPAVFLHCSRCGWDPDAAKPARSQADALAEALEDLWEAGSWEAADERCSHEDNGGEACPPTDPECLPCVQRAALAKMESALAYRSKPAPGETK